MEEENKERSKALLNQVKSRAVKLKEEAGNHILIQTRQQKTQESSIDFKSGVYAMASDLETSVLFLMDQIEKGVEPNLSEMDEILKQKEISTIQ